MQIHFILVRPAVPENIGAAARALKTMGFASLRLVNPVNYPSEEARWLAHGSTEILDNAKIYQSFGKATEDVDYLIGTSARRRRIKYDYYTPEEGIEIVKKKGNTVFDTAIVFGSEESGLTNDHLKKCDIITSIPMHTGFPSLNLAQAVMIYAYLFSEAFIEDAPVSDNREPGRLLYPFVKEKVLSFLATAGIKKSSNIHPRILERVALLGEDDQHLLLSVLNKLEGK